MSRTIGHGRGSTPWGNETLEPEAYRARRQVLRHRLERVPPKRLGLEWWQAAILDEAFTVNAAKVEEFMRGALNSSSNWRVK